MTKSLTATQARKDFFGTLKAVQTPGVFITITHDGHPKAVLLSADEFEGWQETLEIMSDPDPSFHKDILDGIKEMKAGKRPKDTVSLDVLKKKLQL